MINFRVTVASLDEQKQVVYTKTTGVQSVSLVKNDEVRYLHIQIIFILSKRFTSTSFMALNTFHWVRQAEKNSQPTLLPYIP